MGKYSDTEFGVHSGETHELERRYENFMNLYRADDASGKLEADMGKPWDNETILFESDPSEASGDARPFFDSMKSIKKVPASSFVITYLADKVGFPKNESDLGRLNNFAERLGIEYASERKDKIKEDFERILTEPSEEPDTPATEEQLLSELAERVRTILKFFPELDGKTDDSHWPEYFCGMLFDLNFAYLRDIAFAFKMDPMLFEIFLQKVLRRSWINYFDREEILTNIVLQNGESAPHGEDWFELYNNLCEMYKGRKAGSRHPKAFLNVSSEEVGTVTVQKTVEGMLTALDCGKLDVFEYSEELHDILDWVDDRAKSGKLTRSAKKVFNEMLEELQEKLSMELENSASDKPAEDEDDSSMGQKCAVLTIEYQTKADCTLKKGTRLWGNSAVKEGGQPVRAEYVTTEDVQLSSARTKDMDVQVEPVTTLPPGEKAPAKIVKEKYVEGLFRIDSAPAAAHSYEITDKYNEAERSMIEVHPGKAMRFTAGAKTENGTLHIVCAPGTTILAGMIFSFECKGKVYQYKVTKTATAPFSTTAELPVALTNASDLWAKKSKGQKRYNRVIEVVNSGSSISFKEKPDIPGLNVISVSNPKPVKAEDPKGVGEEKTRKARANKHRLFNYLYGDKDKPYEGVTSYGPSYLLNTAQFRKAQPSRNSVSNFPKSDEKIRDMLLTLCFLNFVAGDLDENEYAPDMPRSQGLIEDFTTQCNEVVEEGCGYMGLYSGNPYDEFLRRLLTSKDPLELFRHIFADDHPLTQYIKVNIDEARGKWQWKVTRTLPDGSWELWGRGEEEKGPRLVTLPRLTAKNGAAFEIEIICEHSEKAIIRQVMLNEKQEFELSI